MDRNYNNPLALLEAARELISTPEKWTQGAAARTVDGRPCNIIQNTAACFCTLGALWHSAAYTPFDMDERMHDVVIQVEGELEKQLHQTKSGGLTIPDFNDHPLTTHSDVLNLFDSTINRLRGGK